MTRSERQELCVDNWIRAGGRAAIVGSTGFGFWIHPMCITPRESRAVPIKKFSELLLGEIGESQERRDLNIVQRKD